MHLVRASRTAKFLTVLMIWKSVRRSSQTQGLARQMHFYSPWLNNKLDQEDSMRYSMAFRALFLFVVPLVSTTASAQTPDEALDFLPTALSAEQMRALSDVESNQAPESQPAHARRRLPKPGLRLTAEEIAFRDAVQKLGVSKHRFVHCELPDGKVRTGVITQIGEEGFTLKDGIIISQWIRYTDLKAAPRPVAAVGTRIGQGFKWAGVVVGCAAAIPLVIVLTPLVLTGVIKDWEGHEKEHSHRFEVSALDGAPFAEHL
jgi:hypothetical protein